MIGESAYLGEYDHLVDTVGACLSHGVSHVLAIGQAVHAGHGGDGHVLVTLLVHKQGQDEVGRGQERLPHRGAERLTAPVATGAGRQVLQGGGREW